MCWEGRQCRCIVHEQPTQLANSWLTIKSAAAVLQIRLNLAACSECTSLTQFCCIWASCRIAAVKPNIHQEEISCLGVIGDVGAAADGCRHQLLSSIDAL